MDERDGKTIFVQIPAYRDPELIPTLIDMIDRARRPGRLHVTVCWQHDEKDSSDVFTEAGFAVQTGVFEGRLRHRLSRGGTVVDVLDYSMSESRGCGWARVRTTHCNWIPTIVSPATGTVNSSTCWRASVPRGARIPCWWPIRQPTYRASPSLNRATRATRSTSWASADSA